MRLSGHSSRTGDYDHVRVGVDGDGEPPRWFAADAGLWSPSVTEENGKTAVTFAHGVSLIERRAKVSAGGVPAAMSLGEDGLTIVIDA